MTTARTKAAIRASRGDALISAYGRDQRRRGLMPGTIETRHLVLRSFEGANLLANSIGIEGATRDDIELWLDSLRLAARTRSNYLSCLHSFYEWALENGEIVVDPTAAIRRPKVRQTLPRPIPPEHLRLALDNADAQMRCWLMLGAYQGLRCLEIAGVDREDVIDTEGLLRVLGKGGKERIVPLHPMVFAALDALPMPQRGMLFRRASLLDRYPAYTVSQDINAYLHGLGIPSTAHSLRHYFGTWVLRASHNLRTTQVLMGHSSPTSTAIYTAFDDAGAVEAVRSLQTV